MSMTTFGAQWFTVRSAMDGALDRKNIPEKTYEESTIRGSALVPRMVMQEITNIDYAIQRFRLYCPPYPNALALKPDDEIVDANGRVYHVAGVNIFVGLEGSPHHVYVELWQPSGLNPPPSTAY